MAADTTLLATLALIYRYIYNGSADAFLPLFCDFVNFVFIFIALLSSLSTLSAIADG